MAFELDCVLNIFESSQLCRDILPGCSFDLFRSSEHNTLGCDQNIKCHQYLFQKRHRVSNHSSTESWDLGHEDVVKSPGLFGIKFRELLMKTTVQNNKNSGNFCIFFIQNSGNFYEKKQLLDVITVPHMQYT